LSNNMIADQLGDISINSIIENEDMVVLQDECMEFNGGTGIGAANLRNCGRPVRTHNVDSALTQQQPPLPPSTQPPRRPVGPPVSTVSSSIASVSNGQPQAPFLQPPPVSTVNSNTASVSSGQPQALFLQPPPVNRGRGAVNVAGRTRGHRNRNRNRNIGRQQQLPVMCLMHNWQTPCNQ